MPILIPPLEISVDYEARPVATQHDQISNNILAGNGIA